MSAKVKIKISQGKDAGKVFAFTEHDTFVFGRMDDCHTGAFLFPPKPVASAA